jgi:serine protease Do
MTFAFVGGLLLMAAGLAQPGGVAGEAIDAARRPGIPIYAVAERASQRPWIGIQIQKVEEDYAEALGLPDASGALIVSVEEEGPAAAAGLSVGDVVLAVEGQSTDGPREVAKSIGGLIPGTQTTVTINRNGETLLVSVTIGVHPKQP